MQKPIVGKDTEILVLGADCRSSAPNIFRHSIIDLWPF